MIDSEREAIHYRIETMYWLMSRRFKDLNEEVYKNVQVNYSTSYFHECREQLAYEFNHFEGVEASETIESIRDVNQTSMEEIKDLDQLLVETLAYLDIHVTIPSIEELLHPRGYLIEFVTENQKIPANDEEKNYWMLTESGALEFHGGGWLKNSRNDFILDPYGEKIGSDYIESGLDSIINYGVDREKNPNEVIPRNNIIDNILDSGIDYFVPEYRDTNRRANWYWNLRENEGKEYTSLPEEKAELLKLFGKTNHDFIWPVRNATVTSAYGPRPKVFLGKKINPDTGRLENKYTKPNHDGIDIVGNHDIVSIEKGYVYIINDNPKTFGNNVYIYHGNGISSRYCHLQSLSVKQNQIVEKGSKIGIMGETGDSAGIHLHFETRNNHKIYRDPGTVLGTSGISLRSPDVYVSGGTFRNKMEE